MKGLFVKDALRGVLVGVLGGRGGREEVGEYLCFRPATKPGVLRWGVMCEAL